MFSVHTAFITILAANAALGFNLNAPPVSFKSTAHRATKLFGIRCEGKYYQFEEMEDQESCTSELFLKEDRTVIVGKTNGPPFVAASGKWNIAAGSNDFTMTLSRRYETGRSNTDMGEFNFDLERTYVGEVKMVGESIGITGTSNAQSSDVAFGNVVEVGYFNMIDGSNEREDMNAFGAKSTFS